jgi:hypothetical protein
MNCRSWLHLPSQRTAVPPPRLEGGAAESGVGSNGQLIGMRPRGLGVSRPWAVEGAHESVDDQESRTGQENEGPHDWVGKLALGNDERRTGIVGNRRAAQPRGERESSLRQLPHRPDEQSWEPKQYNKRGRGHDVHPRGRPAAVPIERKDRAGNQRRYRRLNKVIATVCPTYWRSPAIVRCNALLGSIGRTDPGRRQSGCATRTARRKHRPRRPLHSSRGPFGQRPT